MRTGNRAADTEPVRKLRKAGAGPRRIVAQHVFSAYGRRLSRPLDTLCDSGIYNMNREVLGQAIRQRIHSVM